MEFAESPSGCQRRFGLVSDAHTQIRVQSYYYGSLAYYSEGSEKEMENRAEMNAALVMVGKFSQKYSVVTAIADDGALYILYWEK